MLDELSGEGWFIVLAALLLGFGIVRWLISAVEDKSTGIPKSGGEESNQSGHNRDKDSQFYQDSEKSTWHGSTDSDSTAKAWHEVLGVTPVASIDEIRAAYKRKISQYHPDKVAGLGEEFMSIAENKSKEINLAYKQAMAIRS